MSAIRLSNYKEELFDGYRFISPVADLIEPALNAVLGDPSEFRRFVVNAIENFPWIYNMISVPSFFMVKDSSNVRIPNCMPGLKFLLLFHAHINAARLYQMEHSITERTVDAITKADETLREQNALQNAILESTLVKIRSKYVGKSRPVAKQISDLNDFCRAYLKFFNYMCVSDIKHERVEFYGSAVLRKDNYDYQYRTYGPFKDITPDLYAVFERNSNPLNAKIHGQEKEEGNTPSGSQ